MSRQLSLDDLYAIKLAEDPQISPDGRQVAFVVMEIDRPTYEYRRSIWLVSAAGGAPQRYTAGPNDTSPRWSPDGQRLAFVRAPAAEVKPKNAEQRSHGVGKPQVWVLPTAGGEARQLTHLRDGAGDPVWSPDGLRLIITAEVGEPDDAEAADAALEEKRIPTVRTIHRLWYRLDGKGWIYERRAHLFLATVDSGALQQLTDGDWDDRHPAWSPDGRVVAFTSDRSAERWRWLGSDVWTLVLRSGELRRLTDETLECGSPAWSPDGRTLAFGAAKRRRGGGHTDLFIAAADGASPARVLTQGFAPTCSDTCIDDQRAAGHGSGQPVWSGDGGQIYFQASVRGTTQVFAVSPQGGEPRPITQGQRRIYSFSLDTARRSMAFGSSDPSVPGDVHVQPVDGLGRDRGLTELNAQLLSEVQLARPEEYAFTGADGWELQGWVLRPAGAAQREPTPTILEIHGGPHAMYGWAFFFEFQLLAARGFSVIYTNPRGSTGFGRKVSTAVIDDWGGKDFEDILAGLDAAIARGGIDPDRLGVGGGSYGGYMTNWAVGHTDRFKAAVTMRCVSNMASMFGSSDLGWTIADELGGAPWDQPRLTERSPITYVNRIITPLLILHSDNDLRCPIGEGEQMFAALKFLDREVKLVRFEGQTHDLSRNGHPRSRVIRLGHILDWFTSHIPAVVPDLAATRSH